MRSNRRAAGHTGRGCRAPSARDRPGRHQDRDRGARCRRKRALRHRVPTPQGDYDATLEAIARSSARPSGSCSVRRTACRSASGCRARSRARRVCCATPIPCASTAGRSSAISRLVLGRDGSHEQRRELLRAVGGAGRRGRRARAWCSASSWAPGVGAGIVVRRAGAGRPATRSRASGATTRCRGRATTSGPGSACYCGRRGCIETWVSGPGIRARPLRATRPRRAHRARSSPTPRPATRAASPRSRATRSGSRARSRT